jgi:hypothetical protein
MPGIFDLLTPLDVRDTYSITDPIYQKGGWREVAGIAERNAITEERRRAGMFVYVNELKKLFVLGEDLTNAAWSEADLTSNLPSSIKFEELRISSLVSINTDIGNLDDVNIDAISIIKFTNATSVSGFYANIEDDGKLLFVHNLNDKDILILKNNSIDSLEGNRIYTSINNDINMLPKSGMLLQYIGEDLHWRVIGGLGNGNFNKKFEFTNVNTLTIDHNLGYIPSVFLFDVSGVEAEGQVNYVNENTIILNFNKNETGYVILK